MTIYFIIHKFFKFDISINKDLIRFELGWIVLCISLSSNIEVLISQICLKNYELSNSIIMIEKAMLSRAADKEFLDDEPFPGYN